jgi:hypothetical protein
MAKIYKRCAETNAAINCASTDRMRGKWYNVNLPFGPIDLTQSLDHNFAVRSTTNKNRKKQHSIEILTDLMNENEKCCKNTSFQSENDFC